MRSVLAFVAAGLALIAAGASIVSGDDDVVGFFLVLTVVAVVIAVICARPSTGRARIVARVLAGAWAFAAIWIAVLLGWYQTSCACSIPVPVEPGPNVAGLPTTLFHLLATYVGGVLVVVATFSDRLATRADERR